MSEMLLRIHSGHMGIEKCLNRTRHYVLQTLQVWFCLAPYASSFATLTRRNH